MDRGETITAQLSPARTAKLLTDMDARPVSTPLVPKGDRNLSPVAIRAFASGSGISTILSSLGTRALSQ